MPQSLANYLRILHLQFAKKYLVALLPMSLTVIIHEQAVVQKPYIDNQDFSRPGK